ncbi:unnamed protein product [Bursaphelenchus xylophilus]|uniref:(pine wood nematode) hypothetical protein n=1 Tax=Bursaphelenchus xylophilus TaxID=6326 RepID=A0A1I7SLN7_BURXY|nr:unnamed protein product [Bursaphelenchus xylophilus]CAG9129684.1 unnamed protein product [Bursaphelenchus xylophilus]
MATNEPSAEVGAEIVRKLTEAQLLAQKVIGLRQSVIDMDNKRAKLRESYHAIKRSERSEGKKKNYVCICNDLMVQYPNEYLLKTTDEDVKRLDKMIEETRKEIKEKTGKLLELDGDRDLREMGFELEAITDKDFADGLQ